jgi:hypothetical protein
MFGLLAMKSDASNCVRFNKVCGMLGLSFVSCIEYCVFCIMICMGVVGSGGGKVVPNCSVIVVWSLSICCEGLISCL